MTKDNPTGLDQLELRGLEVFCIIGDLPHERRLEQLLLLDVILFCDLAAVCSSDSLSDTIDYANLSEEIRRQLRQARCRMIEYAAEQVAQLCLRHPMVKRVRVHLQKSGCVTGLRAAAITIERSHAN